MYGGRIRGQGSYGCVFQPALLCRGKNTVVDSRMVGKVTSHQDAENELEIAAHLRTIPDVLKYAVLPQEESCVPRPRSKQYEKEIKQCEFTETMSLKDTVQIIMPWGGYPLGRINLDPAVFNYYQFLEDMLAIGAFFVLHDVCHFDIWGQNILFNSKNTPRVIDYGFAFQPSKFTNEDLHMRWRLIGVDHDTETPEVTLMVGSRHNIQAERLAREIQLSKPAVQRLVTLCDVNPNHWSNELVLWSQESQSFQHQNWLQCWKLYWPGFDAWGIGAMLLQVLELQMSIPEFTQTEQWKERSEDVKRVLRGLCRGSPIYRLDAVESLSLWTKGAHPLIGDGSSGNDWIVGKEKQRPKVV